MNHPISDPNDQRSPAGDSSPESLQGAASANTPPHGLEYAPMHQLDAQAQPRKIQAGLRTFAGTLPAHQSPEEAVSIETLTKSLRVTLSLDMPLTRRLLELWNGLLALGGDELLDWNIVADIDLTGRDDRPAVVAVGATVYATGEVAFSVTFENVHAPMWFDELLDLNQLDN